MLDLYVELRRITEALDRAGVPYALVGGLAVSIYTAPRATEDIDLFLTATDLERAITAVLPLGFEPAGRPMPIAGGRLAIQRLTKIEGHDFLPLDLMTAKDPELARLLGQRVTITVGDRSISVIDIRALRILKRLRGSALDRADLEALGPDEP